MFERLMDKLEPKIREWIGEAYKEGYADGQRHMHEMYRFGWQVGHSDTMAALGQIDIDEIDVDGLDDELDKGVFEEVEAMRS